MSTSIPQPVLEVVETMRQRGEADLRRQADLQMTRVVQFRATGSDDMDETFSLQGPFRLIYVRCHLVGGTGTAQIDVSLDSSAGSAYDARLTFIKIVGNGFDANWFPLGGDLPMPSPWIFQAGDGCRLTWPNPDRGNMTWGLEVGLARA